MSRRRVRRAGAVRVEGGEAPFTLVNTPGRRSVHLVVDEDHGLEVRAPWRFTLAEAAEVVVREIGWVRRKLAERAERLARVPPLGEGPFGPYLGRSLLLRVRSGARPCARGPGDGGRLEVAVRNPGEVRPCIERWYRERGRGHFVTRVEALAPLLGERRPTRIVVRGQRTRWGSCSASGTVSLNWRLMMLSPELVDYVVVHELAHLYHLNHSPPFWALVEHVVPEWRLARREIRIRARTLPR